MLLYNVTSLSKHVGDIASDDKIMNNYLQNNWNWKLKFDCKIIEFLGY